MNCGLYYNPTYTNLDVFKILLLIPPMLFRASVPYRKDMKTKTPRSKNILNLLFIRQLL